MLRDDRQTVRLSDLLSERIALPDVACLAARAGTTSCAAPMTVREGLGRHAARRRFC